MIILMFLRITISIRICLIMNLMLVHQMTRTCNVPGIMLDNVEGYNGSQFVYIRFQKLIYQSIYGEDCIFAKYHQRYGVTNFH